MYLIVDRIEGNYAVCEKEDRTMIELRLDLLPYGIKEGTVLNIKDGKIFIDEVQTLNKKRAAQKLLDNLF